MNLEKYRAVFFDLDGTLIDTAKDLTVAIHWVATEMGFKSPSLEQVKSWIGRGVPHLISEFLNDNSQDINDDLLVKKTENLFLQAYKSCLGEHSELYPHVKELLVQLLSSDKKIACITNKPYEFTDFLMQQTCIRQFFHIVCSGDHVEHKKPDPWSLNYCMKKFGLTADQCLMVGDSVNDILAARAAGCDVIAVNYGYNAGVALDKNQVEHQIDDLGTLL